VSDRELELGGGVTLGISSGRGGVFLELEGGAKSQPIMFDVTATADEHGGPTGEVRLDALNLSTGATTRFRLDAKAQRFLISQLEQSLTIQTWISSRRPASASRSWFSRLLGWVH
jgi:hypothetical protein